MGVATNSSEQSAQTIGSHGQHPGSCVLNAMTLCSIAGGLSNRFVGIGRSWGGRVVEHEATKFTTHPMILNFKEKTK
jgi:hypothetical protein